MDISALSTTALNQLSKSSTSQDVGILMLSKQLDTTEAMSAQMVQAMEQSVNPAVGGNFDASI